MPTSHLFPKHQLNTYFQSQPVLFQFILNEFLSVLEENQGWEKLLLPDIFFPTMQDNHCILLEKLHKLSASPQDHLWQLPWNFDVGFLTKLKNYSYLFARNAEREDPFLYKMHDLSHQTWILCKQTVDILQSDPLFHPPSTPQINFLKEIQQHIEKIQNGIQQLKAYIITLMKSFHQNENILFFLLRYHERFCAVFEKTFVRKFFLELFPQGLEEARSYLIQRYSERGFDQLVPVIERKFLEI